jgi:putative ABC transport system ATP-binding protein
MSVITTENITKVYNETKVPVHALNGVDLRIEEGEFTAIVGPSGSGKSTFLNMLGGLDTPTQGRVAIGGEDISHFKENQLIDFRLRNIGFIFQSYNLIPVFTAKENVEFIMLLQKISKKEREKRAEELLERVGLKDKMNNRPSELSGGQQQRVAVARALASKPRFILADEPTANLDSASTANLMELMSEMNRQEKITFIFSTHDDRVISKARRVITLVDGKIGSDHAGI